jgi:hypothetical protein
LLGKSKLRIHYVVKKNMDQQVDGSKC